MSHDVRFAGRAKILEQTPHAVAARRAGPLAAGAGPTAEPGAAR